MNLLKKFDNILSLSDGIVAREMKLEDTHLNSDTALLLYHEKGRKLHQERSILYQTPKSLKKDNQKSSTVYHTVTRRTQGRLFNRNESINVDECTETSPLQYSGDGSLGLEITGNYSIS